MTRMLVVKNLEKIYTRSRFDRTPTFRLSANFTIENPGVIGMMGPNGSGKTTLFSNIYDLARLRLLDSFRFLSSRTLVGFERCPAVAFYATGTVARPQVTREGRIQEFIGNELVVYSKHNA